MDSGQIQPVRRRGYGKYPVEVWYVEQTCNQEVSHSWPFPRLSHAHSTRLRVLSRCASHETDEAKHRDGKLEGRLGAGQHIRLRAR
jgi:hypothetical protein